MPHFLIEGSYTADGLRGLPKDKASGREAAVKTALDSLGGKLIGVYQALGEEDVFVICECPDHVSAAALALAASSSGLVKTKTIPLMTVAETDKALTIRNTGHRAQAKRRRRRRSAHILARNVHNFVDKTGVE